MSRLDNGFKNMDKKLSSISATIKTVIDSYPLGHTFYGNELKDDVVRIYPESQYAYVDTFLKMARRHRRDSYICIDRNNSLYKRVESNIERAIRIARETPKFESNNKQLDLFSIGRNYA